jgi:hypothetical protein
MAEAAIDPASQRYPVAGKPFVFGVSGHRDPVPADLPELRNQLQRIFQHYRSGYPTAPFRLLSPLAEGADRIVAEVALHVGIELEVPLPMALADYERDFESPESLADFRRLLRAARSQWEVSESAAEERTLSEGTGRAQKYAAVGDYIARTSHVLILLWDGRHNQKVGGTSWVKRRREHWIEAATAKGADADGFAYGATVHVLTPRAATEDGKTPRPRIEIVGGLPAAPGHPDERSRL